jgi:hypothetical protein
LARVSDFLRKTTVNNSHALKFLLADPVIDPRQSGMFYNSFPWPLLDQAAKTKFEKLAKTVLNARGARAEHESATLAGLYDRDVIPGDLRAAHLALDEVVDQLYRKAPSASARVEHLFRLL